LSFIVHDPSWDHRAVEREVAVGELAQVPQHLGLGVVLVEHRVREVLARAREAGRDRRARVDRDAVEAERLPHVGHVSRVVVSSSAMPSVSASTRRRLTRRSRAYGEHVVGPSGHAHP
jgi:hypothetical protein